MAAEFSVKIDIIRDTMAGLVLLEMRHISSPISQKVEGERGLMLNFLLTRN